MNRRIRWLGAFVLLCFLGLFVQLNHIQVFQAHALATSPSNPRVAQASRNNPLGIIVSSNGTVLAESVPSPAGNYYRYHRSYPTGSLFAQIVGYDSIIYGTTTGVESYYRNYLVPYSVPAPKVSLHNLSTLFDKTGSATNTLRLTVSVALQQLAATELGSRTGAVVAIDPSTGAILAMYSNPSFDPNPLASPGTKTENAAWASYESNPSQPMLQRAWRRSYPPGSTFKVITTSAVYDKDPSVATKNFPAVSQIALPGTSHLLHNYAYEVCGGTMAQMLPPSCDTGYSLIGLALGPGNLEAEASAFGIGRQVPLDINPPPAISSIASLSYLESVPSYVAFSAIGQGNDQMTALQMALVAGGIANDGTIMRPHVLDNVRDATGRIVDTYQPASWLHATSPVTASQVTGLMTQVAQHGTAAGLFSPSWDVAAKTGTAQIGQHGLTTDWMIGFAPANAPKVALAVVVPRQAPGATGASEAGPIMAAMFNAIFGGTS